jgi:hypothetical protein
MLYKNKNDVSCNFRTYSISAQRKYGSKLAQRNPLEREPSKSDSGLLRSEFSPGVQLFLINGDNEIDVYDEITLPSSQTSFTIDSSLLKPNKSYEAWMKSFGWAPANAFQVTVSLNEEGING